MDATNDTFSLTHINTIMPLISLMSAHFLVSSFTLISDMDPSPTTTFMKIASNHYLEINPGNSIERKNLRRFGEEGYIVYDNLDFDLLKLVRTKPKLVVVIARTDEITPLALEPLTKLVIPYSVPLFVVLLPQDARRSETAAKCFRLYKPTSRVSPKSFPMMHYGGPDKPEWVWESKKTDWNSFENNFEKETRNMSEVTVTIALVSFLEENIALEGFWKGRNSFFWTQMQEHLKFRARTKFHKVPPAKSENMASIYLALLRTVADGLGVLPVITSERALLVEPILTGLDAKNHIMVRAPYYIHSWQSIFKPFAPDSWLCLGIAVLLTAGSLKIVTSSQNPHSSDFSGSFLTTIGIICGQGGLNIPTGLPARMVCYTCIFFSILIYQFYTSNFYSLLSTKEVTLPFTSLEQFVTKKTHSMYIHPNTAVYSYIMKAKSGTLKKIWDDFLSKDPSHLLKVDTRAKVFDTVCDGKGVIFGLAFQTVLSQDLKCKLVTVSSGYFPTNIITAVRKNFPYKPQFQFVHLRLLEAGITHKYRDRELRVWQQQTVKTEVTNEPVSLEHVAFLLVFDSACVILSWILLGLEVIASKALKRGKGSLKGRVNKFCNRKQKPGGVF